MEQLQEHTHSQYYSGKENTDIRRHSDLTQRVNEWGEREEQGGQVEEERDRENRWRKRGSPVEAEYGLICSSAAGGKKKTEQTAEQNKQNSQGQKVHIYIKRQKKSLCWSQGTKEVPTMGVRLTKATVRRKQAG